MDPTNHLCRRCVVRRSSAPNIPDLVPNLSRGKHRSSRRGACFMEMASYLAGERWTDHPRCTHPLVASGRFRWIVLDVVAISGRRFAATAADDGFAL